jgi:hypothetical protein
LLQRQTVYISKNNQFVHGKKSYRLGRPSLAQCEGSVLPPRAKRVAIADESCEVWHRRSPRVISLRRSIHRPLTLPVALISTLRTGASDPVSWSRRPPGPLTTASSVAKASPYLSAARSPKDCFSFLERIRGRRSFASTINLTPYCDCGLSHSLGQISG